MPELPGPGAFHEMWTRITQRGNPEIPCNWACGKAEGRRKVVPGEGEDEVRVVVCEMMWCACVQFANEMDNRQTWDLT